MDNENKRQSIYNHVGAFLVFGIMLGSGLLLIKASDKGEPIKITEPPVEKVQVKSTGESVKEVKGESISGLININTASQSELETLDGVGPKTAEKIIEYRETNGPFKSIEAIMDVNGIGEGKFAQMEDNISI